MADEKRLILRVEHISIRSLYSMRAYYDNYPPFQRDQVWKDSNKRYLVDSILRGFYVPAIIAYEDQSPDMEQLVFVIDGQQRLSTILDFLDGKVLTANAHQQDEPLYRPIEPNRPFKDLSPRMQNLFLAYTLQFVILEKPDDQLLGVMFRRLQHQIPLSQSEKLWSYGSQTTRQAQKLIHHPFWKTVYQGSTGRKQAFQTAMYFIYLELSSGFANVTTPRLRDLAAGQKDSQVTDELIRKIGVRLDAVCHLFAGTSITAMTNVIPLYQAVLLLEEKGCNWQRSRQGCLTVWFKQCYEQHTLGSRNIRLNGFLEFSSQICKSSHQRAFWEQQLPVVSRMSGLVFDPEPQSA